MHYDYLIVGAGIYGAVFAHEMKQAGKSVLVIEKRDHIAGNIYTEEVNGIQVHKYGAHIFHTSNKLIWEYVNQFAEFNQYINSPVANYKGALYNLPFNMNTFYAMWGVTTPDEAKKRIEEQVQSLGITEPKNLEEQALSLVGTDIYEKLIQGYTQKQWGRDCTSLPSFIIKRLPVRFTYDNNYFNDPYQGIPIGGYTQIVEQLLKGTQVLTNTDYFTAASKWKDSKEVSYDKVLFTGMIDEFYQYDLGTLEYRSLAFEEEALLDCDNYQGNAVVNYTAYEIPYTRIIEHKHFEYTKVKGTVITREYPKAWTPQEEPYYPINDHKNNQLYEVYEKRASKEEHVLFGGRLGGYRYFDMDKVIEAALALAHKEKGADS
ncbi:MAG: UDP-galactopyranose mutase [Eubacteriales bacterium]